MKKLFSILLILTLTVGLSSCTTRLEEEIALLEEQISTLTTQKELYQQVIDDLGNSATNAAETIADLEEDIEALEEEILALQEMIYENVITFTFTDVYGNFSSKTVGYHDDYEGTLFDLLEANFDVTYTDSTFGKFITELEDLNPTNGSYISFLINGEVAMVGVDAAPFDDTDVFSFEISWFDNTEKAVFEAIELFLMNQVQNYTNETYMDYNVLAGLSVLGKLEDYVSLEDVETYLGTLTLTTIQDYFKVIIIKESMSLDASLEYTALNAILAPGDYGQTAFGLLAMNAGNTIEDFSAYEALALADLQLNTPFNIGLDAGGISLVALSDYTDEAGVEALITEFANWISTDQLASGGIKTRNMVYGDVTYFGTENAASISQVILGLVASGIDPTSAAYTKDNDLVFRLTEFQLEDGSFDWDLTDEITNDLAFSTPQAFLALAAYYQFSNSFGTAVNPYLFAE